MLLVKSLNVTQKDIYKSLWAPASSSRTQANEVGVLGNCLGHRDGLGIMHTPMPERKGSFQYYSSSVIQFFRTLSWFTPIQSLGSSPYTGCKLRSSPPLAQAYPISRNSPHWQVLKPKPMLQGLRTTPATRHPSPGSTQPCSCPCADGRVLAGQVVWAELQEGGLRASW